MREDDELAYSDWYTWATLVENSGEYLTIDNVPFKDESFSEKCYMCDYGVDPCTHFSAGAVALYDCEGNLCPEFDQCLELLNEIEAGTFYENDWDEYSITDKAGDLCAHSITTPYKY